MSFVCGAISKLIAINFDVRVLCACWNCAEEALPRHQRQQWVCDWLRRTESFNRLGGRVLYLVGWPSLSHLPTCISIAEWEAISRVSAKKRVELSTIDRPKTSSASICDTVFRLFEKKLKKKKFVPGPKTRPRTTIDWSFFFLLLSCRRNKTVW